MSLILEGFIRRLIQTGNLTVEFASGKKMTVGDGTGKPLGLHFVDTTAEHRFLRDPELAMGELYTEGLVTISPGDIYDVVELGIRNIDQAQGSRWVKMLARARTSLRRFKQHNDLQHARANVAHHYDIDGRLYTLFLDSDRQYSCAYFERPDETLEEAQLAKKRHIAAKLLVEPGQRVLDIGCGWGGMGLYLANFCKADVVGVTLSKEQLAYAQNRAEEQRLGRRVEFRLQDYRDVPEKFDRIVSVGMFEHVGVGYYDAYFQKVASALKDDGVALIHTIGSTGGPSATNPWIAKYIFPGGYIPSMSEMLPPIERAGLMVTDVEILRLHYAKTLRAWRERFMARREEAAALYDEQFCRMWEFYLSGSEATFRLGQTVNFQLQLARRVDSVPLTRDYIADRERQLRARDSGVRNLRLAGE